MPQGVGRDVLGNAGSLGGFATGVPGDFVADRDVRAPVLYCTREQVGLRLHPAPVFPQRLQQFGAERHVAVATPFAGTNVHQLALAVDIADLQTAQFGATDPGRIERHQPRPVQQVARRIDEPAHFFLAETIGSRRTDLGRGCAPACSDA